MGKVKAAKKLVNLLSKEELDHEYIRYQNYMGSLSKNTQKGTLPKDIFLRDKFPTDYRHHYTPFSSEKFKDVLAEYRKYPPHPEMIDQDYDDYLELMRVAYPYKKPMTKNQLMDDMWGAKYRAQEAVIQEAVLNKRLADEAEQLASKKLYEPVQKKKTPEVLQSGMSILKGKGFFPQAKHDAATERVLHEQLRSLIFQQKYDWSDTKTPFLTRLKNKDPKLMDNLSMAVNRYTRDVEDLVGEKHRIMDPTKPLGKKLRQIAAKFYGVDDPNKISGKLVDFAHVFPLDETVKALQRGVYYQQKMGKVIKEGPPKSDFLDLAGSAETMYLSPSYVNQHIQRSLEGRLRDLIALPDKGYLRWNEKVGNVKIPTLNKVEKEIKRLSGLLEKVKALSHLTSPAGNVKKFGYQAKETFGRYGAPRFSDDELEELFTYLLEAEPMTVAQKISQGIPKGLAKSESKWKGSLFNEGGIVNGYSKGGSIKKLLDETIGMMSRRKFLKGMGATAAHAAMPKAAMKISGPVVKKAALNFAPPWVNGMLSALKDVPITTKTVFRMGNNSQVQKIGSKKIKLYGGEEGTESYFRVKTSLDTALDDAEIKIPKDKWFPPDAIGSRPKSQWDEITLTEEPGQKTITFNNKAYDGNDQHIVIDTKNKETRFVDDNWHMEAGGEDIAKDDWIEWTMDTDKKKLAKSMGLAKGDVVDDKMVDEWSVNGMTSEYGDIFEDYVDSFTPFGNIFGTVQRALNQLKPKPKFEEIKSAKPQEMTKKYRDMDEMEWEGQFRGGKGMHGYARGGTSMRDYPQQNKIVPKRKPPMRTPDNWNMENVLNSMSFVESTNRADAMGPRIVRYSDGDHRKQRVERAHGQYQILPSTARQPGYGVNPWANFSNEWDDPVKSRNFARSYLQGLLKHHKGDWFKALSQYGGDSGVDYWNKIVSNYNKGGIARRPNAVPPTSGPDPYATLIDESVAQIRSNPSEFMGTQFIQKFSKGGFVRKNAPKVIAKLTNYRPKLTMAEDLKIPKKKRITEPQIKVEETIEEPGAMFWGSREKIIGAPSEAMTGTQWLTYMKLGKHGILNPRGFPIIKDMELNDTSLAPWLSRMGNKTVSKESLVKQFDDMAPTMDVVALGDATGVNLIDKVSSRLKKIDTQAIRNPQIKGFYDYMKTVMPQLKESLTSTESKGIIKSIDDMVYNNFGIKDALTEGVPQRFPFEIKEILQSLSTAFGKRTAGFKKYKRSTQHEGTQMMEGGDNYREFLFRYKPGSLRSNEPQYRYAHDFNLSDADRFGGVVHTRTSDRGDEFGRRLLHIEEIQSDMHQKVNAAQRQVKKQIAEWEKQGLKPHEAYLKLSTAKRKEFDKLTAESKYAPRGDLKEEIGTANEQHFALVKAKIEDLLAQPQTKQTVTRLTKLKRERTKIRKMIEEEKAKMAEGSHSGIPQGPLSKTEDYNEFIMKYLLRVAREGGYDGITINTPAIKNKGLNVTNKDYRGNLVAYGPMAKGAMEKAAKKSGAKLMKTYIKDGDKKVWEVPMILFKENKAAQAIIDKGLPIYKKGGIVKK